MRAWLWLLEDEKLLGFAQASENYPQYGAPILRKICEEYDLPQPKGNWWQRMSEGEPCEPGCVMGCDT